jgi:hypothetical protein
LMLDRTQNTWAKGTMSLWFRVDHSRSGEKNLLTTSKWGKSRADAEHPEAFGLPAPYQKREVLTPPSSVIVPCRVTKDVWVIFMEYIAMWGCSLCLILLETHKFSIQYSFLFAWFSVDCIF